jgi:DNA-binding transcriptional MerR regulator
MKNKEATMLKIGELARRSGMTVRALHHYDSIGLLTPSARSDSGYRLYDEGDLARLRQIQALRGFGMPLADIGSFLANPDGRLLGIIERQIAALTRTIDAARATRDQLEAVRDGVTHGRTPDLASWLTTLENTGMYDKYFNKDELAQLPFAANDPRVEAEWQDMVARARRMLDEGRPPSSPEARQLGRQWMVALERDTGGNPEFALRLTRMNDQEPELRAQRGLTPDLVGFVMEAFTCWRLELFRKYMDEAEFAYMSKHYRDRGLEWPGLIARVRAAFEAGTAPGDPQVRALMGQWNELTVSYVGTDPATHARLRQAYEQEPQLMVGSWISDAMRPWIGQAMAAARQAG